MQHNRVDYSKHSNYYSSSLLRKTTPSEMEVDRTFDDGPNFSHFTDYELRLQSNNFQLFSEQETQAWEGFDAKIDSVHVHFWPFDGKIAFKKRNL